MSDPNENRIEPTLEDSVATPATPQEPEQPRAQAQPPGAGGEAEALAEAQARIAELQAQVKQLGEQYLRAQADMQNTRRRAEEEMAKARKFAVESFAEAMLPVVDSLELGLSHPDATAEQLREGTQATLQQLKGALERNKVVQVDPAPGDKFDPHRHQAISMVPAPEGSAQEANTIVTVLQKGYLIAERVLRPALVTVAGPR